MPTDLELPPLSRRRRVVNATTQRIVALGGIAVIGAIVLIFVYLLWVVVPMFKPASIDAGESFQLPAAEIALLDLNETGEVAVQVDHSGTLSLFATANGQVFANRRLAPGIREARRVFTDAVHYALLDTDNQLHLYNVRYRVNFDDGNRQLVSDILPTYSEDPIALGPAKDFDSTLTDDRLAVAALREDSVLLLNFRDAETGFELDSPKRYEIPLEQAYDHVRFGPRQRSLYLISDSGDLQVLNLANLNSVVPLFVGRLAPETEMTTFAPILGRTSWMVASPSGRLSQRFLVRNESGYELKTIRDFDIGEQIQQIVAEPRRKGFVVQDTTGELHLGYSTTGKILATFKPTDFDPTSLVIAPRSDYLLAGANDGELRLLELDNKHPEVSWGTLWSKIWYEGYSEPIYSWQSSSAVTDFEPKFSLTPLLFGTLKAAAYALLFAVPIAIMGALYTAYFMAPAMRALVKPGIEIMAALPTVILGFLAGLWLAPILEDNLSSVLSIFLILPIGLMLIAGGWRLIPDSITRRFDGWYGLIVIPPILLMAYSTVWVGPLLEDQFFGGDSRTWFREYLGLGYDQRNALVVGIAMGLAVIPAIFSIAEDAIYGVPQTLINGSLALGATPWQTLVRVVLLTASPGIFSAVMIGMGRAVGETMIVLMATGNTPVMDWNIFQGMRTFAANIAVELPEAEVASTHYRILFLAALVLFFITFLFNTVAELVRQRLRARYGRF